RSAALVDLHSSPTRRSSDLLVQRHGLRGIKAFSRESFRDQLAVPGITLLRAVRAGRTAGAHLWYVSGSVAYSHLMALSADGYAADRKSTRLNSSHLVISYAV